MDESHSARLSRKASEAPFMVAGIAGCLATVAYSIYGYRKRSLPTSVYIIHTRVVAQGIVVSALTLGIGYSLYKEFLHPRLFKKSE